MAPYVGFKTKKIYGTLLYSSINNYKGKRQSSKNDLESIFMKRILNIYGKKLNDNLNKINKNPRNKNNVKKIENIRFIFKGYTHYIIKYFEIIKFGDWLLFPLGNFFVAFYKWP